MAEVGCYIDNCAYTIPTVSDAAGAVMLGHHLSMAHPVPATAKAPPIPQPRLGLFQERVGRIQKGKQQSGRSLEHLSSELLRS